MRRLFASVLVTLMLIASACGSGSRSTPTGANSSPTTPAVRPTTGQPAPTQGNRATASRVATSQSAPTAGATSGVIRWSNEGVTELPGLDPSNPSNAQSVTVISLVFGGLVRLDEHLKVQPDAAESWTASQDSKVFTFKLRPDLKFADGSPVTADDFAYSFNRALTPTTQSYTAPFQLKSIQGADDVVSGKAKSASGIKVVDPHTLQITLTQPSAYFITLLTYPVTFVVPRKLVESGSSWQEHAYGTGPFMVKQWVHNQSITLAPNPNYWRGKPQVSIYMPFIQNSDTAFQLYQTNKLDIMGAGQNGVPSQYIPQVQNEKDFVKTAQLATRYIGFNNKLAPFDNEHARRAFAFATDRNTLANQVLNGQVTPTTRILPKGFPGSELPIKGLDFDLGKAKQELQAAGVNPSSLKVTLTYGQEGENERVAQVLQSMWQDNLGVKVDLQPLELATFSKNLDTTRAHPEKGLQMYLSIWGADYPDPQNFLSQQLQCDSPNNNGHWCNQQFDQLTQKADTMGGQAQYNQRLKLYNQAEQIAVDGVGWLPLYNPTANGLVRPTIKGLVLTGQGLIAPDWSKVTLEK